MHKSRRMLLAEAIQDVVKSGDLTRHQASALKNLAKLVNESAILDALSGQLSRLKSGMEVPICTLTTRVCRELLNEALYGRFIEGLNKRSIDKLNEILEQQHSFYTYRINKLTKKNSAVARNIVQLILDIDFSKFKTPRAAELRKVFGKRNLQSIIKEMTGLVNRLRPVIILIINRYAEISEDLLLIVKSNDKGFDTEYVSGVCLENLELNYMNTDYTDLSNNYTPLRITSDTSAARAIKRAAEMPFTLDEEFNNAVMAIIDTETFDTIIRGKSTDEESTKAKIQNIRSTVKNGVKFWEEAGKGIVYFNYSIDFRGRISQLGGISAVGNKVGKAMLRSGVKYPLGPRGYDNLLIALAGAMGHDKETFKVRLDWGKAHADMYADIGGRLLTQPELAFNQLKKEGADEIFSAAAISLELWRIKHRSCSLMDFESDIFVGYDATSSAVQLVGLIMGNGKLTEASNVRVGAGTEDKIHDSYMLIADSMDLAAPKMKDEENEDVIEMWLSFPKKIKRAIAKPLMMTRLYGSKFRTHMVRAKEVAVEKGLISLEDREKLHHFGYVIAVLFNKAFNEEEGFNALRGYEDFVKAIAKAFYENDKHVTWNVHDGGGIQKQPVRSQYVSHDGDAYYYFSDGKKRVSRTYGLVIGNGCANPLEYNEKYVINKMRTKNAIAPNYIHSHDALVLHRLTNSMTCPIRLTHDCFAVTPGMVDEMHDNMIEVYADLFGDNKIARLELLQKECFEKTGVLVDLPSEYNPNGIPKAEIKAAKYMIS